MLELKGRNYSLEEQARKQKNALGEAEARVKVIFMRVLLMMQMMMMMMMM